MSRARLGLYLGSTSKGRAESNGSDVRRAVPARELRSNPHMFRVLKRDEELEELVPAWRELMQHAHDVSPFQTPEWLLEWWRAFGGGALQVMVDAVDRDVRAIGPFFVRAATAQQPAALVLIGTGNSDWLDVIAAEHDAADRLVAAAIDMALRSGWQCDWRRLPAHSPLLTAPGCANGLTAPDVPCAEVPLPSDNASFDRSLPGKFRRNLGNARRRAEREGRVEFDIVRGPSVQPCLDDLFRLHEQRWTAKSARGVLGDPVVQRFLRAVAARMDRLGRLRLVRLRIGGDTAAVLYGFRMGPRDFFYIGGFNPAFASVSPGSLAIREAVRTAIDDGQRVFDFLAGQEAYKYGWGARDRPHFNRLLETAAVEQLPRGAASASNESRR